jgi:hypothetical protein
VKYFIIILSILSISACDFSLDRIGGKKKETATEDGKVVESTADDGTKGAKVGIPAGSLAIDADIAITEGQSLANSTIGDALGIEGAITGVGSPVNITAGVPLDDAAAGSLSITLPLEAGAALQGENPTLVAIYHIKKNDGTLFYGVIPRSLLTIGVDGVTFTSAGLGTYQLANLATAAEAAKPRSVPTQRDVVNKELAKTNSFKNLFSMAVAQAADMPPCDVDHENQLIYVEATKKFVVCRNANWADLAVNFKGPTGAKGVKGDAGAYAQIKEANNNVGIGLGANAPAEKLHVQGNAKVTGELILPAGAGVGKKLISDATGVAEWKHDPEVHFHVGIGSGTIATPSMAQVNFDNVTAPFHDGDGVYDETTNYRFDVPKDGLYQLDFNISGSGSPAAIVCEAEFYINGADVVGYTKNYGYGGCTASSSIVIPLAANDYVNVKAGSDAAVSSIVGWFSGARIGD